MKRKLDEFNDVGGDDAPDEETNIFMQSDCPIVEDVPAKTMKKMKQSLKHHDFSVEEINRLKETETLFHSGLFKLQLNELLKNVSVKLKLKANLESAIDYLSKVLSNLPEGKEHQINARTWLDSRGIKIPLIENPSNVKGVFHFVPPSDVKLIGSFHLNYGIKPNVSADLVMLIPKDFFQGKDYLNHRYPRKRALYLASVASYLSKKKKVKDVSFDYHSGNPQKPLLVVSIQVEDDKRPVTIILHAVPDAEPFKLSRFHIVKNNVRPKWFYQQEKQGSIKDEDNEVSLPGTKFYNACILHDLCLMENHEYITEVLSGSEGIRQGLILLKVWLRQRELSQGFGMFSNFLMTAFVAYLVMTKKISKRMTSYQIFKTTLFYMAKGNWQADPPALYDGRIAKSLPSLEELRQNFDVAFLDHTGGFNLAYMLSSSVYLRVKSCAEKSIQLLDQHHQNSFDVLFMTPMPFARTFDHIFHISIGSGFWKTCISKSPELSTLELDLGGCQTICLERHLESLLQKALEKRIFHVQVKPFENAKWNLCENAPNVDSRKHLTFGLILDPTSAFGLVDKGPPADDPQAAEFRAFWGDVSEMRRFKDGSIHEAVLWSDSTLQSEKRLVCKKIVQHILKRHYGMVDKNIVYHGSPLDDLLHINVLPKEDKPIYGTGEEQSLGVLKAFDQVNQVIRSLTSLPLTIHSVQGTHSVFRHADVFPPLHCPRFVKEIKVKENQMVPSDKSPVPQYTPVLSVLCMLEGSGSWPGEKEAIDCMKTLLHLKMGTELSEKNLMTVSIKNGFVDVLKDGFVFRLKIACMRELSVLKTIRTETGMVKFKDTDDSVTLEKSIVSLPLHSHLMHGIQQEHPAFSSSVRLCKRWLGAHMVWDHVNEEAIELMVASLFINATPYSVPMSPCVGFIRFLSMLSSFSWKTDILMVNLNREFTEKDYQEIPQVFLKNRSTLPAICIATPQDKTGIKWTKNAPSQLILDRLIILAKASLRRLEQQIMSCAKDLDFKEIFRPLTDHFDVTVKLREKLNTNRHQSVDGSSDFICKQIAGKTVGQHPMPVLDFNPFQMLLNDLKEVYGDFALFFFDPFGGCEIGIVWKPSFTDRKDFKPSSFALRRPVISDSETVSLEIAKDLILDDIYLLGRDIIEVIEDHKLK